MSNKSIFVATHPRACSTAFERVFMTRRDTLTCVHEPFGDAYYFGPERLGERYEHNEKERTESGFSNSTYKTILDRIEKENAQSPASLASMSLMSDVDLNPNDSVLFGMIGPLTLHQGKRLFIKDMIQYFVPPNGKPASIAPSLARKERGVGTAKSPANDTANGTAHGTTNGVTNGTSHGTANGAAYPHRIEAEPNNPTVIPEAILKQFHFTFLIRHPRSSIPSYYRCTIPPLDEVTGFYNFEPCEAGYDELRRVFDYLRESGQIGPRVAGDPTPSHHANGQALSTNGQLASDIENTKVDICVVDADDLLDNPTGIIEAYCKSVEIDYHDSMLNWDTEEDQKCAKDAFAKWKGFHEDAIHSSELKPRLHKKKVKSNQDEDAEWTEKFGAKGAKIIRDTVDANIRDYEYLKQFALKA